MKISNIKLSKTQIIDYTVAICLIISAVLFSVVDNMNSIPSTDKAVILLTAAALGCIIVLSAAVKILKTKTNGNFEGIVKALKSEEKEVIATN